MMKRSSLFRKLSAYFLIVIVFSLATVGAFSYWKSSKELDKLEQNHMTQIVNNAVHHTDLYLKAYARLIVSMLSSREIKQFIDLPADPEAYEYYFNWKQIRETAVDPLLIRNPEIAALYIISFNGNGVYYFADGLEQYKPEETRQQLDYFKQNTSDNGQLEILNYSILTGQKNQMLTLVRQIKGLSSPSPQGILAIELRSADLSALWKGVDLGTRGYFFIADEKDNIVYHPDGGKVGTPISASLSRQIAQAGSGVFESREGGEDRMYMARKSDYSGWNLVVSTPVAELRKPIASLRLTTLVVGLLTFVLALGLAYRFGKSITKPIQLLKNGMRQTEKGNWATIPLPERSDEITDLVMRYNLMVNRLSELVEEVYEAELRNQESQLERQRAEFQSLQLQINPHFLYNTLETIVCHPSIQESEDVSGIVKSLAYMLRYSVQTNLEEITVANELKHVMYYLMVLRYRIGREFDLDVDVTPDFLLRKMVRLTLQPLVENALQHAFPDGIEDFHYIRIDAGESGGMFRISVEDNGCGISEAELAGLRERLEANRLADEGNCRKGGIGILNVHRRIQMVFGEAYGLRIESKLEQGTKMIMELPAAASADLPEQLNRQRAI